MSANNRKAWPTSSISKICIFSAAISLLAGCASGPRTTFQPLSSYNSGKSASSEGIIKISKVNLTGDLDAKNTSDLMPSLIAGFSKNNSNVNLIDANKKTAYFDSELLLDINSRSSLSARDYYRTLPLVAAFGQYANGIDFNWDVRVNYFVKNVEGQPIEKGSFVIKGADRDKPGVLANYLAAFWGIAPLVAIYPDTESQNIVSSSLMTTIGEEISKRLNSDKISLYLAEREKQRDGMDIKTYVAFMEKKKRLESERVIARAERLKGLDVQIKDKQLFNDIKSGTVMVLGIGVSKYQSSQIPALKYADRDSQRVVDFFKTKYKLSDDRAMLLMNEDATATKISRFISNNAMQLLDKDDTFVLYFGGHGAPDVDSASTESDGIKKYLLMHDSEMNSLPMTALSLNNLAAMLEKLPCKRVVILLDSCFAGTAGAKTLAKLKSVRISEKSYKNIADLSGEGRVILAASSENQVSHEEDSLQAGVFTHYLLKGLNGRAESKGEGNINILGLYEYVNKEVSKHTNNKQSPVFRGTLDANIIF